MKRKIVSLLLCAVLCASTLLLSAFSKANASVAPSESPSQSPSMEQNDTSQMDIADIVGSDNRLATLASTLKGAGLVETLRGKGPYTLFAPTDNGFKKLNNKELPDLLKPENKGQLVDILLYHIYPKELTSREALKNAGEQILMQDGKRANIVLKNGELYINDAKVIVNDIKAKNGVIHIIDTVLIPENEQ